MVRNRIMNQDNDTQLREDEALLALSQEPEANMPAPPEEEAEIKELLKGSL